MNHAQDFVAVLDIFDDNAHSSQIVNLVERAVIVFHLFIDAVKVFRSAADLALYVKFLQKRGKSAANSVDKLLSFGALQRHFVYKRLVNRGLEYFKTQVLQFAFKIA